MYFALEVGGCFRVPQRHDQGYGWTTPVGGCGQPYLNRALLCCAEILMDSCFTYRHQTGNRALLIPLPRVKSAALSVRPAYPVRAGARRFVLLRTPARTSPHTRFAMAVAAHAEASFMGQTVERLSAFVSQRNTKYVTWIRTPREIESAAGRKPVSAKLSCPDRSKSA
jgi:hypothetical protein